MVPELKRTLPATPSGYFDDPEIPRQVSQPALRDDLDLCFVCMRWTSADTRCMAGMRCEYQRLLDTLDAC